MLYLSNGQSPKTFVVSKTPPPEQVTQAEAKQITSEGKQVAEASATVEKLHAPQKIESIGIQKNSLLPSQPDESNNNAEALANSAPIDSPADELEIPEKPGANNQSEPGEKNSENRNVYSVHVGFFKTDSEANLLLKNMKPLGFPSFMYSNLSKKGNTVYVVVAGKYQSYGQAKEASQSLSKKGYSNFVARAKDSLNVEPVILIEQRTNSDARKEN